MLPVQKFLRFSVDSKQVIKVCKALLCANIPFVLLRWDVASLKSYDHSVGNLCIDFPV